ncbi:MAG: type I-U CRISPR-associated protein Csb2, partial [Bryobacteraceae bacterium]
MTVIRLQFLAGRYHATPWGRNVNEGVPEWPPSPYRFLRALYDVWRRKCPDMRESTIGDLFAVLAAADPSFTLPTASASHTRSYLSANSEDPTAKNLVFDAFTITIKNEPCFFSWPDVELTETQREALVRLLAGLNYLGRSESWVQASLHDGPPRGNWRCLPADHPEATGEIVATIPHRDDPLST